MVSGEAVVSGERASIFAFITLSSICFYYHQVDKKTDPLFLETELLIFINITGRTCMQQRSTAITCMSLHSR